MLRPARQDAALAAMLVVQGFALFIAAPFGALGYSAWVAIADLLLIVYVLLILIVSNNRVITVVAIIVTVIGLADDLFGLMFPSMASNLVAHAATIVAVIVLSLVVAGAVFAPGPINTHRILGAIVLYLNLALFFGTFYRFILDFAPAAFAGVAGVPDKVEGEKGFASIVYFSFVTLTSTGYGDILPINPFARSLANLESIVGQLFPAILLARLVAQHLEQGRQRSA